MAFEKITNIVEEYYVCNRLISFELMHYPFLYYQQHKDYH